MGYLKESIEACDALLAKYGAIARRTPGLFPEERRKLERMGMIKPPAPAVKFDRTPKLGRVPVPRHCRSRAAVADYLALPDAERRGSIARLARKHSVSPVCVSYMLRKVRLERAMAHHATHPKAA